MSNSFSTGGDAELYSGPGTVPAGQTIWLRAAWVNRKQEAGPLSVPITTNLPGGGSAGRRSKG